MSTEFNHPLRVLCTCGDSFLPHQPVAEILLAAFSHHFVCKTNFPLGAFTLSSPQARFFHGEMVTSTWTQIQAVGLLEQPLRQVWLVGQAHTNAYVETRIHASPLQCYFLLFCISVFSFLPFPIVCFCHLIFCI